MMRILVMICLLLGMISCSEENKLEEIEDWQPEYTLPQGGNAEADAQIVEMHKKYGCYILYDYTWHDFQYDLTSSAYHYVLPDPQYVDEMLDFLNEIWLKFYPDEFHRKYIPYRILFAETMYSLYSNGNKSYWNMLIANNTFALSLCSDTVLTVDQKIGYKRELHRTLLSHWVESGLIEIPAQFIAQSDYAYNNKPSKDKNSANYVRKRGFINHPASSTTEIMSSSSYWKKDITVQQRYDFLWYCYGMVYYTDARWEEELKWPLVKKKYDIVLNYFKEEWGFDISKIGNTPVE